MKKTYLVPTERIIMLGAEENVLLTTSDATEANSGYTPDDGTGDEAGNGDARFEITNLWDKEW